MRLSSLARRRPEPVWAVFEPILPAVVWCGDGRPPASNRAGRHGRLYVLITGIGWEYVPACFPCGKTIPARLDRWRELAAFRQAWRRVAEGSHRTHGVNWDQVPLDGSKTPSKKGVP